jgi:hypothetical protein
VTVLAALLVASHVLSLVLAVLAWATARDAHVATDRLNAALVRLAETQARADHLVTALAAALAQTATAPRKRTTTHSAPREPLAYGAQHPTPDPGRPHASPFHAPTMPHGTPTRETP